MSTTTKAASAKTGGQKTSRANSSDAKRTQLKQKVSAAQQRNAERSLGDYARGARDGATSFVKEHPIATVAGGLALGVLVASLVPGPGRRLRKQATARGALLAGVLADLAIAYGTQFADSAEKAARAGQDRLGDLGDTIGAGVRSLRGETREVADDFGTRAVRTLRDLRARMAN